MSDMACSFDAVAVSGVLEVRHDLAALDEPGFWVVVATFEGELTAVRMDQVTRHPAAPAPPAQALDLQAQHPSWESSMDQAAYEAAVREVRARIARGEVYQVNVCRVLRRAVPAGLDVPALAAALRAGNPAPHAATIDLPEAGLRIACASPELFLARDGDRLVSGPIKGTAASVQQMLPKDHTENVMITDLVRNDLSRVSVPGTVWVDGLCVPEVHPGLVHLVSTVSGRLRPGVTWADVWAATFPPGSVSGAPKSTALQAIYDLEAVPRGPYCGAIGYIDNDTRRASLAVGIRTFWLDQDADGTWLHFGTGAGITWGSDPAAEWQETELKAARLIGVTDAVIAQVT